MFYLLLQPANWSICIFLQTDKFAGCKVGLAVVKFFDLLIELVNAFQKSFFPFHCLCMYIFRYEQR